IRQTYGSYQNWTVTFTWAGTGLPCCVAGEYLYCLSASSAAPRNASEPDRILVDLTCPVVSTTASTMTLPVAKCRAAAAGGTARTDCKSFGGTISPLSSGTMGSASALAETTFPACFSALVGCEFFAGSEELADSSGSSEFSAWSESDAKSLGVALAASLVAAES